ncbi:hypothetical protein AGMMS4952_25700 [Spirochaetia bacterium]|nr:hypothetical protein AGMMS4952_25700 [Spirochaetia bacterium]
MARKIDGTEGNELAASPLFMLYNWEAIPAVNSDGRRFMSEELVSNSALWANASYSQGGTYFIIFDEATLTYLEANGIAQDMWYIGGISPNPADMWNNPQKLEVADGMTVFFAQLFGLGSGVFSVHSGVPVPKNRFDGSASLTHIASMDQADQNAGHSHFGEPYTTQENATATPAQIAARNAVIGVAGTATSELGTFDNRPKAGDPVEGGSELLSITAAARNFAATPGENGTHWIESGNTLQDLARALGMSDPQVLEDSITRYNAAVDAAMAAGAAGNFTSTAGDNTTYDAEYHKPAKYLQRKITGGGKYYAMRMSLSSLGGSSGGIMVNENLQVLNNSYRPVPNLYAAGLNAGGFYGPVSTYYDYEGSAMMFATNSGRIAGSHAGDTRVGRTTPSSFPEVRPAPAP